MEQYTPTLAEIAGDPCEECDGKGYTVSEYTWDYGTEWEPHICEACDGSGFVLPVVETEELIEHSRLTPRLAPCWPPENPRELGRGST